MSGLVPRDNDSKPSPARHVNARNGPEEPHIRAQRSVRGDVGIGRVVSSSYPLLLFFVVFLFFLVVVVDLIVHCSTVVVVVVGVARRVTLILHHRSLCISSSFSSLSHLLCSLPLPPVSLFRIIQKKRLQESGLKDRFDRTHTNRISDPPHVY